MIKHNIGVVKNENSKYLFFDATKWYDDTTQIYYFISQRNVGKTTGMWNKILDDFVNEGKSSLYMRRQFTEIDSYKKDVLKIITLIKKKYDYRIRLQGTTIYFDNKIMCEMISLSTAHNKASGNFDNVSNLYFDEVQSRTYYLPEEYKMFTDFIATSERFNGDFKVYMFGNALSKNNPYLSTGGIGDKNKDIMIDGIVKVIKVVDGKDIILPNQQNTIAYRLSQYDDRVRDYMYLNKFAFDDDTSIMFGREVRNTLGPIYFKIQLNKVKYQIYKLLDGKYGVQSVFNFDEKSTKPIYNLTTFDGLFNKGINTRKKDLADGIYEVTKLGRLSYGSETARDELFKGACMGTDLEKENK